MELGQPGQRRRAIARLLIVVLGVAATGSWWPVHAQTEPRYQIIVNDSNPVSTLTRSEVSRLFLKKTVTWKAGREVVPVDLAEGSAVRQGFSKDVLKKNVAAVKGYWQQLIFTGRGVPPVEKASEAEVIAYVAANRNAVGYVSSTASLGAGVKPVRLTQ